LNIEFTGHEALHAEIVVIM